MVTTRQDPQEKPKRANKTNRPKYWRMSQGERDALRHARDNRSGARLKSWHKSLEAVCGQPVYFMSRGEIQRLAVMTQKERQGDRAFR